MKRIFTILIFILTVKCYAQTYVTIPDTAFAAYLRAYMPSAMNGNQLDTSNVLIKKDTIIYATNLNIRDLTGVQYFPALKRLMCVGNLLTSLPPLPNSITSLECSQNQLTTLPALPNNLLYLYCDRNQLTSLPTLPNSLIQLLCDQNLLTNLPVLPNKLEQLSCGSNLIVNLPMFPQSLKNISCNTNQLTSLPPLPDSLQILQCYNNKITCFPPFPNTIGWNGIFIFNNPFTCLPNYIDAMKTTATLFGQPLLSYPLCGLDNPNGCPVSADVPTSIIIPNIFTPNGDSINDTFFVKGANLTNFSCKIYDRWGALLYQWTDINTGWNGKDKNGATSADGTYYYVINYTDNTGKTNTKNGFLQLLR